MRIKILDLMDGADTLYGVPSGRACLARLLASVEEESSEATLVFLDFSGVAAATVSFLREGPLAFRSSLRGQDSNMYPVFANLSGPVADSLDDYLRATKDAAFVCELSPDGVTTGARLVGQLEPAQRDAFDAVRARGEVSAIELSKESDAGVGTTAWNNRLAALAAKGLVVEKRRGRRKAYQTTLEEA